MNETPAPVPVEKTIVVKRSHLALWILTITSLCLNVVILVFILVHAIGHHHRHHEHHFAGGRDKGGWKGGGPGPGGYAEQGFHGGFHHEGFGHFGGGRMDMMGGGMGHREMRGGEGFDGGPGGGDGDHHGWGGPGMGMKGEEGGPGHHHGMGGMGMDREAVNDPAKATDMILDHLSHELTLTDDEKAKIKPIVQAQVTDMQKMMEDQKQAMQKQFEDGKAKIRPLLTAEQQKQLDAMHPPGEPGADEGKAPPPPGK